MNTEIYSYLVIFILICILGIGLFFLSNTIGQNFEDLEKFSAYECGFSAFSEARQKFEIKFYLVGILFLIFDLELLFLIPWVIMSFTFQSYISGILFLLILSLVLVYEMNKGALDF